MTFDPNYLSQLSQSLVASATTEQNLTTQLSSGLRAASLSDDAVGAATNVGLQSAISGLDSFVQSASGNTGLLQITDSALGEAVTEATSALSLATQGANGTLNGSNLTAIAAQVGAARDRILSLGNTSYQGSYLFSGSQAQIKPFAIDSTTAPASTTYSGDNVIISAQTPGGQSLALNVPGAAVFTGLLNTLNQLQTDLQSGSTSAVASDSASLSANIATVNLQRGILGSSASQLSRASTYASTQEAQLTAQQSTLLSADTVSVATGLKSAEVQHQALISVISALAQDSLFSYLK